MPGLTSFITREPPMLPKLNRRRALFVLGKIDEILAWEQRVEHERDTRFVELGRYLCEVRAGQYWRLENLKSFDDFLERRFPESRRKAYYLMSIHEHLPKAVRHELKNVGWAKAAELVKVARSDGQRIRKCNLVAQGSRAAQERIQARGRKAPDRQGHRAIRACHVQALQESIASGRAGAGNRRPDARI